MMICCRGRQRLQVEENVTPPGERARGRAGGRTGVQRALTKQVCDVMEQHAETTNCYHT